MSRFTGVLRPALAAGGLALMALAGSLVAPDDARATRGLTTGFGDALYQSESASTRGTWMDQTVDVGGRLIRVGVNWAAVATKRPKNPRDPSDPAYTFSALDAIVADANARGLRVMLTVANTPAFAQGPNPPSGVAAGAWKPDPKQLGDFGAALAAHYGPTNADPSLTVRYLQVWTEPNLEVSLAPQYAGKKPVGAILYRRMLDDFYGGVKAADRKVQVVTGGAAPYGDPPGGQRTRPMEFWRTVFCMGAGSCGKPRKVRFDVLAQHAINTSGSPTRSAISDDDISTADLGHLRTLLRRAERSHSIGGPRRHDYWITEFWWDSNPPDRKHGYPPAKQARYIEQTLYLIWKAGATVALNLQIRDSPGTDLTDRFGTGIFFLDGVRKPSWTAFHFPFVTDKRGGKTIAWGKAPVGGRLAIKVKRGKRWSTVMRLKVKPGQVFTAKIPPGVGKVIAQIGAERSLAW